jgi:hypothetical protein
MPSHEGYVAWTVHELESAMVYCCNKCGALVLWPPGHNDWHNELIKQEVSGD